MAIGLTTGRYRIVDRIATGGMGEVYRAVMGAMGGVDKAVALKVIRSRMARDPELAALFIEEAKVAMTLSHANVVTAFDVGRIDERLFLALELVDGIDLAELIEACFERVGQPIPHRHVIFIAVEALKGLDYAHRRKGKDGKALNIVHRDVSPGNILISFEGEVKVADFGIAKSAMREVSSVAGTVKGKVPYMAPEQLRGEVVDRRADLYAVGAVLYEMLTGRRIAELGRGPGAIPDVLTGNHPPPRTLVPSIPEELERIVERALSLRREDRYENAATMRQALEQHALRQGYLLSSTDLADFVTEVVGDKEAHRRARTMTGTGASGRAHATTARGAADGASPPVEEVAAPRDSDEAAAFDALLGMELLAVESEEPISVFTTSVGRAVRTLAPNEQRELGQARTVEQPRFSANAEHERAKPEPERERAKPEPERERAVTEPVKLPTRNRGAWIAGALALAVVVGGVVGGVGLAVSRGRSEPEAAADARPETIATPREAATPPRDDDNVRAAPGPGPNDDTASTEASLPRGVEMPPVEEVDEPSHEEAPSRDTQTRRVTKARTVRAGTRTSADSTSADSTSADSTSAARTSAGAGTGTLAVNTDPWSNVYLDGHLIGPTPILDYEVPSGSHRLVLRNDAMHLEMAESIVVRPGEQKRVSRTLRP